LGLPYPGGPALEALAAAGAPVLPFPRVWLEPGSLDFSFSGLKSAVVNTLRRPGPAPPKADVAASFQAAAIDVLVGKTAKALAAHGGPAALAGGVAQNQALRQALTQACAKLHIPLKIPKGAYCADNAAMIGACGYFKYLGGCRDTLALNAYPTMMRGDL
jgi:N6-L-threonylcarbamoyladenine synthase